ncbi:MAG: DUF433 domain-containing protein [Armatimonadetes bacterium]|nr:DUF433 domain-containing protein [Armatimonadota bacterium]
MKTAIAHWALPQFERLEQSSPERFEAILAALREVRPDLFGELTLMAAEHGEISHEEAGELLGSPSTDVEQLLTDYREVMTEVTQRRLIELDARGVARIAGKHVTVWEVVREYRRVDSVSGMNEAFPGLSELELRAALVYAGRNPDEIGGQIRAYEEILERSKAAYPYAK